MLFKEQKIIIFDVLVKRNLMRNLKTLKILIKLIIQILENLKFQIIPVVGSYIPRFL